MVTDETNNKEPVTEVIKSDGGAIYSYIHSIIKATVKILIFLLLLVLLYSVAEFVFIVIKGFIRFNGAFNFTAEPFDREKLFFTQVQGLISAVLLLTIVIELIQSLMGYLKSETTNYVGVIIEIALIASVRHILTIDLEHIQSGILYGLSALILVLGLFFIVINRKLMSGTKLLTKGTPD
jgi:uncharacterized membrane protein (DUF373 family)